MNLYEFSIIYNLLSLNFAEIEKRKWSNGNTIIDEEDLLKLTLEEAKQYINNKAGM